MKMNKLLRWAAPIVLSAQLLSPVQASAQEQGLMSPAEMSRAALSVKNADLRKPLNDWVVACTTKQWGACQMRWWDLTKHGLTSIEQDGYSMWGFLKQPDANQVVMHLVSALNYPAYRSYWDLELETSKKYEGLPRILDGRDVMNSPADYVLATKMIRTAYKEKGINLGNWAESDDNTWEWYRMLAFMFTMRNDATNAYQVLTEMQNYATIKKDLAADYAFMWKAVTTYHQKGTKS